jgi:ribosomal protein L30E
LKLGKLKTVYITKNAPNDVISEIEGLKEIGELEIIRLEIPNTELGTLCKKPFPISILSIIKE